MSRLLNIVSGEFMLRCRPNSGSIVLLRSAYCAAVIYAFGIFLHEITVTGSIIEFSQTALKKSVHDTIPWLGALFAGTYVSLYTRYSSQWTYLASMYNQFMSSKYSVPNPSAFQLHAMMTWQAGFVSDCFTLHLDRKPIFKGVIASFFHEPVLRDMILENFDREEKIEFINRHANTP